MQTENEDELNCEGGGIHITVCLFAEMNALKIPTDTESDPGESQRDLYELMVKGSLLTGGANTPK